MVNGDRNIKQFFMGNRGDAKIGGDGSKTGWG